MPGSFVLHCLPEFAQTHDHWLGDAIQLSHPLPPSSPPALNLSQHHIFFSELALCIKWPKDWSFSFSVSPSNEYSGLISFRIDWFDFLAVQGTLNSPLQPHSSKALTLHCSAFFMVQLSHLYRTAGKTIALAIQTFVSKVMSLLFTTLCRFVIAFLMRSKHLLVSLLQSLSAVILEFKTWSLQPPAKQKRAKVIGTTEERGEEACLKGTQARRKKELEGERGRGGGGRNGEIEWEKADVSVFSRGACSLRIFTQWSNTTCVHTSVYVRVRWAPTKAHVLSLLTLGFLSQSAEWVPDLKVAGASVAQWIGFYIPRGDCG